MRPSSLDEQLFRAAKTLDKTTTVARFGRVTGLVGTVIRARVPGVQIGERCRILRRALPETAEALPAEVIAFDEQSGVLLMPLGHADGISLDDAVIPEGSAPQTPSGDALLGRVVDALGNPIDGLAAPADVARSPLMAQPPHSLRRKRVAEVLPTGVRVIDTMLTVGRGQRVGIFAPAGGGKSTLLAALARNVAADAVVLALVGERRREVAPFIEDNLGPRGLGRCTVVVSTSDEPALLRLKAVHTASAIAEAHRRQGKNVVLLVDSVTRFARALREVGLAAGELPARRGFPPSVFAELPRLFERAGNDDKGTLTAFYTVLLDGPIADDPIAEEVKSLLDGHFILSEELAHRGHYPAIDPLGSKSRLMSELVPAEHRKARNLATAIWKTYEENRVKIELRLYEPGSNPKLDATLRRHALLESLFKQALDEPQEIANPVGELLRIVIGQET